MSEPSTLPIIVEAAIQIFGHIDVLINNAGIAQRSLAKETVLDVDRRIMEVDYFGTIALTKYLLPHFLKRKSGHFVTVSSVMGKFGTPYRSGYAAAKHALHGVFDSLRAEVWKENKGIQVTLICPGWIRTNITINALTGSGERLNQMDPTTARGLTPDACSKEIFAIYLKRFFPGLFSRIIRKAKVR